MEIYGTLKSKGLKVCIDDRDYSIGEKLKDNELFGIRKTIIVGNDFLKNNLFDFEDRQNSTKEKIDFEKILTF